MAYRTAGRVGSSVRCWPFYKVAPSVGVGYWGSERDSVLPRATQHWAQCHGGELWVRRQENRVGRALLETELERISNIIIILEILIAATISWAALVPGSVLSALLALSLDSSQQPYENNTVSSPISWVRKLRLGGVNIPKASPEAWCSGRAVQSSPCTSTLDAPLWTLSEGRCRLRGRLTAPQPVTSRQQAGGEWLGGCTGLHLSQVIGHVAAGARRRSLLEALWPGRGAWALVLKHHPSASSFGAGEDPWNSAPRPSPGLAPSSQQPGPGDALAASPQRSPQPVLNLSDSCPQPSQLQLISEGVWGPG